MFLARWLLGFTVDEWWNMDSTQRTAYERGMSSWLPQILFGVDGIDKNKQPTGIPTPLSGLPGGAVVVAGES